MLHITIYQLKLLILTVISEEKIKVKESKIENEVTL